MKNLQPALSPGRLNVVQVSSAAAVDVPEIVEQLQVRDCVVSQRRGGGGIHSSARGLEVGSVRKTHEIDATSAVKLCLWTNLSMRVLRGAL